jgi:hypothetical protein
VKSFVELLRTWIDKANAGNADAGQNPFNLNAADDPEFANKEVKPTPLNIDESEEGELNIEDEDGTSLTF